MRLTSKERGDRVAKEFLGTTHAQREYLKLSVAKEIDESAAEAIGLVRQLRPYLQAYPAGLIGAIDEFLLSHGVKP